MKKKKEIHSKTFVKHRKYLIQLFPKTNEILSKMIEIIWGIFEASVYYFVFKWGAQTGGPGLESGGGRELGGPRLKFREIMYFITLLLSLGAAGENFEPFRVLK